MSQDSHWQEQDVTYDNVTPIRYRTGDLHCPNPVHHTHPTSLVAMPPHIIPRPRRISPVHLENSPSPFRLRERSDHRFRDLPPEPVSSFAPSYFSPSGFFPDSREKSLTQQAYFQDNVYRQRFHHEIPSNPPVRCERPVRPRREARDILRKRELREPLSSPEYFAEWHGTSSDVVAAAQISAWRDAARAGANFVTPEVIAAHIKKTPKWVKSFWHTDPRILAKNLMRSAPAPHPQPRTHNLRLLCGTRKTLK